MRRAQQLIQLCGICFSYRWRRRATASCRSGEAHFPDGAPQLHLPQKLKERQKTKGIKLDKKKKAGDDIKISLGPIDALRWAHRMTTCCGCSSRNCSAVLCWLDPRAQHRIRVPSIAQIHRHIARECARRSRRQQPQPRSPATRLSCPCRRLNNCGPFRRERWVVPDNKTISQRLFIFAGLALWSLYQSAQTGPAFQVLKSFSCFFSPRQHAATSPPDHLLSLRTLVLTKKRSFAARWPWGSGSAPTTSTRRGQ